GGGNTENCRHTTSLKYRLTIGQARVAAIWQFGGYGQNNASNGAYQVGAGGDIPHLANGVLSFDAIYSYVRDSVWGSVAGGPPARQWDADPAIPAAGAHRHHLRQQSRDAVGEIHQRAAEIVRRL